MAPNLILARWLVQLAGGARLDGSTYAAADFACFIGTWGTALRQTQDEVRGR